MDSIVPWIQMNFYPNPPSPGFYNNNSQMIPPIPIITFLPPTLELTRTEPDTMLISNTTTENPEMIENSRS
jgi:hypothetical protein